MNDTLKVAGRIGAELGAAKAENERLREALHWYAEKVAECRKIGSLGDNARQALDLDGGFRARDAISQQAEPTDTYTAVDMATAAAQGFMDGQAAVEPAPEQDGREAFEVEIPDISAIYDGRSFIQYRSLEAGERLMTVAQHLRIEKQLRAALTRPAQTAPQGKFRMGDLVKKSTGSEWEGRVVGWYSTEQTKEGYAVESSAHRNSVQIYPAKALEAVE